MKPKGKHLKGLAHEKDPFTEQIVDEIVELMKDGMSPGTAIFKKSREYARTMQELGAALARRKL